MRVNRNHIWMMDLLQRGDFLFEAMLEPALVSYLAAKEFHHAALLPFAIVAAHHVGKAAAGEQFADFETAVEKSSGHLAHFRQKGFHAPRTQIRQDTCR